MSTSTDTPPTTTEQSSAVAEAAAEQARGVASTAATATQDVASTAKAQAGQVAEEAAVKAKDLLGQTRAEVSVQAEDQARRLAINLRRMCGEMANMADAGGQAGSSAHQLVQGLAVKGAELADFLETRGAGGLVAELQSLGRRRPGAFLLGALAAGVAAGRLGKAAKGADSPADGAHTSKIDLDLPGSSGRVR